MTRNLMTLTAAAALALAAGCSTVKDNTPPPAGTVSSAPYGTYPSGSYETAQYGYVRDIKQLDTSRRTSGTGAILGAVIGGAVGNQIGHGTDRILDRRGAVDAVLVIEIDVIDAETAERRLAGLAHVVGLAADAEEGAVIAAHIAELRGQDHLIAAAADGASDQLFVPEGAVHIGRVEEVAAEVESAVDGGDRRRVVVGAVKLGHPHATEADGGDREAGTAGCAGCPRLGHRLRLILLMCGPERSRQRELNQRRRS